MYGQMQGQCIVSIIKSVCCQMWMHYQHYRLDNADSAQVTLVNLLVIFDNCLSGSHLHTVYTHNSCLPNLTNLTIICLTCPLYLSILSLSTYSHSFSFLLGRLTAGLTWPATRRSRPSWLDWTPTVSCQQPPHSSWSGRSYGGMLWKRYVMEIQ